MNWFWKSKSGELKAVTAELQSLQEEMRKRDAAQSDLDISISNERRLNAERISELTRNQAKLESDFSEQQKKLALLDTANHSMADVIRDRERQLAENQKTSADAIETRDAKIQHHEQNVRRLETEIQSISSTSQAQLADLTSQLATANEQIRTLEQRMSLETSKATSRITSLEQQLAESETRSANRAEQRSALLRNMTEIHRLSTVAARSELTSEPLKLVNPGMPAASVNRSQHATVESNLPNPHFHTTNAVRAESESA